MRALLLVLSLLLLVLPGGVANAAEETYFGVFFSYEAELPSESHSFVTFLELNAAGTQFTPVTISWLPAKGDVTGLAIHEGKNYDLKETLQKAGRRPLRILGPYRITKSLYDLAAKRLEFLVPANVEYKMVDWRTRSAALENKPGGAVNCIHAVSDIKGFLDTGVSWGAAATEKIRDHFKSEILDANVTYPQVLRWLGL